MNTSSPLVSIVIPVFNGATFLVECLESVVSQTYQNWELLVVDNCSTDHTREIASSFAERDSRIQLHSFGEFLTLVQNFNRAVGLISRESKYCKVLAADDWIFPRCIERLVEHAESNPSVGIIGSYQLSGGGSRWCVKYAGLPYPSDVISGREICRWHLLDRGYAFGTPTSTLYRADLVRSNQPFFPGPPNSMHSDVSACYEQLKSCDFGFVHEVLSFERVHSAAASATVSQIYSYQAGLIRDLLTYGPFYLTKSELRSQVNETLSEYYGFVATGLIRFRGREFREFHKGFLREIGRSLYSFEFARGAVAKISDKILNPKSTIERLLR